MNDEPKVIIYIGQVFATREPVVIKTVLGSCIAACLRDPVTGVSGMNHFMLPLPGNGDGERDLLRFGVHAMDVLIGKLQRLGGERSRLQAKAFGGGHVLRIAESDDGVPQQNIRFIREFLTTEGIPLVAQDLGGHCARQVAFHTGSGTVRLRRLTSLQRLSVVAEREHERQAKKEVQSYGGVTLFD